MTIYDENETFKILNSLSSVSLDKFDDRLRLQKLGYLAQALGASGGFTFSWYLRGPYSSSLTNLLYGAQKVGVLGKKTLLLKKEKSIVNNLKKLLKNKLHDIHSLELYASVWYLLPKRTIPNNDDKKYVIKTFSRKKSNYTIPEIKKSIQTIQQFKDHQIGNNQN